MKRVEIAIEIVKLMNKKRGVPLKRRIVKDVMGQGTSFIKYQSKEDLLNELKIWESM